MSTQSVEETVSEINTKVTSMLILLKGHELDTDDKGMVGIQNDHEKRIGKLEKLVGNLKYFIYGLSLPAAWGLADMIKKIF